MQVGVIHFGPLTAGSHHIIRSMVEFCLKNDISLKGIKWNHSTADYELKELNKETIPKWENEREIILSSFPIDKYVNQNSLSKVYDQFDSVVVLGGENQNNNSENTKSKVLEVPISILNDIEGSELSLGFDTALNVVVNNILKIQDSIASLIYSKPRIFCAQIPGSSYNPLLENAALAVNGHIINEPNNEFWNHLSSTLKVRFDEGLSYSIILINESIDPNVINRKLTEIFDFDFKWNSIDESQCVGSYPTAVDRVLAVKLVENITKWIKCNGDSNRLLINNYQVTLEK